MILLNNTIVTTNAHKEMEDDLPLGLPQERKWLEWPLSGVLSPVFWTMAIRQRSLDAVFWTMLLKVRVLFYMDVAGESGNKWVAQEW
jgi:hypothetical protein